MPIYSYECVYCQFGFDELRKVRNSGKSQCPKCGNVSFKIPAIFSPRIFKKREFADGTSTPNFVSTPKQEKAWLRSEGITYDKPNIRKSDVRREKDKKRETVMEAAFKKAHDKCKQGFKIEGQKEVVTHGNIKRIA